MISSISSTAVAGYSFLNGAMVLPSKVCLLALIILNKLRPLLYRKWRAERSAVLYPPLPKGADPLVLYERLVRRYGDWERNIPPNLLQMGRIPEELQEDAEEFPLVANPIALRDPALAGAVQWMTKQFLECHQESLAEYCQYRAARRGL